MARIEHIKRRLDEWSRWSQGGSGYASSSPLTRIGIPRSASFVTVATDVDQSCLETEQAVRSLLPAHIDLWHTINAYYVKVYDIARCAKVLGVAESSVKARLCRADAVLDAWFVARQELAERAKMNKTA